MSVLLINHVYTTLQSTTAVTDIVGTNIYPVDAPLGVPSYPYAVVTCEITGAEYNKEGHVQDLCRVTVNCVSKNLDEAITLQQAVRDALEGVGGTYDSYLLDPLEVTHADCIRDEVLVAYDAEIQFTTNTQKVE